MLVATVQIRCIASIKSGMKNIAKGLLDQPSISPEKFQWVGSLSGSLFHIMSPANMGKTVITEVIIIVLRFFFNTLVFSFQG
jgi:hypothetical protein